MKTEKQIREKYNELVKVKVAIIKERDSFPTTFDLRIVDVNAKMQTIDWLFGDVEDV